MNELRKEIFPWILGHSPLFLLPLLILILYLPAFQHDFILDDSWLVIENPYIKSWKYLPQLLGKDAWNLWGQNDYWRPVFSLSLALDYSLWGLNPFGFHLTNIILHAINAVLLYSLGNKLQGRTCAVFASLLYALHPIQAHTVNVISTRGDLLAALFALLSVGAFLSRRTNLFVPWMVLALLSKEVSVVLPLVFIVGSIILQREKPDLRHLLGFAILGVYFATRLSLGFSFSLPVLIFSYDASTTHRILLVFKVLGLYILSILNLFEIPHPFWTVAVPTSLYDSYVIVGILIFGLLLGAVWKNFKDAPLMTFGLTWFVIYFLPISNLKELNQPMAEHWLYIPMIGISLAFGSALNSSALRLPDVRLIRTGVLTMVVGYLVIAALVVREKTKIYQNDELFLLAALRANPQVAGLYSNLGGYYLAKQDIPKAQQAFAKALEHDPEDFLANYGMGVLTSAAGRRDEAKAYLKIVVRSDPLQLQPILIVAHAWEMLDNKQWALFYYRKALDLDSQSSRIRQKIAALTNSVSPLDK